MYIKKGSKFKQKYGKSLKELSKELKISVPTLSKWLKSGIDVYEKAKTLHIFKGNKRLKQLWNNINNRCYKEWDSRYEYYHKNGIENKLSKEELVFLWQRDEATKMVQPSLDRINNLGHYELSNCRFIEMEDNRKRKNTI